MQSISGKERSGDMSQGPRQLVRSTAEVLRQRIFDAEPGERIGSLREIAEEHDVGIVTIQQVARVLEHEGLLEVRRGPGGGYFARRPDLVTLEGVLSAYMRSHPASWEDALDLTSLLFIELCAAAAQADDEEARKGLADLQRRIATSDPSPDLGRLEEEFQDILFQMVDRPLFELLTRVTLHFAVGDPPDDGAHGVVSATKWHEGRGRIIAAILDRDAALARFEATRSNRDIILKFLQRDRSGR